MPLPFDATLKQLVRSHTRDWLDVCHVPADAPVEVLTPDLSTVTHFADTVLRAATAASSISTSRAAPTRRWCCECRGLNCPICSG
jgi:hypothetical protein